MRRDADAQTVGREAGGVDPRQLTRPTQGVGDRTAGSGRRWAPRKSASRRLGATHPEIVADGGHWTLGEFRPAHEVQCDGRDNSSGRGDGDSRSPSR